MESSDQEVCSNEKISISLLSTEEQEQVLQTCSIDIEGMIDLEQVFSHLFHHNLLSDTESEILQASNVDYSRKKKIAMLITSLPRKGSDALDRFVKCLVNSADGTGHGELAQIICNSVNERHQISSGGSTSKTKIIYRLVCYKRLKYTATLLVVTSICSMLYFYWPTIMYHFNLIHSESLPYLSKNFVGREKEMNEVSKLLDFRNSDIRIVNIYGSPGFGKSTLAIHIGHKMVKNGVTVHYVNMDDFPDKDIKMALAEKILEASHIVSKNITFERLLRWARERSSKTLVILDNCDDLLHKKKEEFHQTVVKVVEESLNIKVTLTSRKVAVFLMYFEYYKLEELSITASCQLLEHKVPSSITLSSEEKEQIAKLTGNVPLALQIIGSILHLPDSPSPTVLIDELQHELIKTLSPADLPVHDQVFTTINLSYKYLTKELQQIGRQLTIFPGSFKLPAAFTVCNSSSASNKDQLMINSVEPTKEFGDRLKSLVRNSLVEHGQRTDRYQYHRLIKEYFLLIQRRHWPNEAATPLSAFHIYYSGKLIVESGLFQHRYDYEQSLAFLDSEQHNLEYLFENLKQMQSISTKKLDVEEFLMTALALSSAVNANFLQTRFSMEKCCMLLNSALNKFDMMMPNLRYYLLSQSFEVEYVLHYYLTIIKQVAECERKNHGVFEAMLVYSVRKTIFESKSAMMMTLTYINFYKELSRFYSQLGKRFKGNVLECYRLITSRTHAHLTTCQPNQCQYYDFGVIHYMMGQYQEASICFEEELKGSKNIMQQVRALVWLVYIYSYIDGEDDKMISTVARLQNLYSDIAAVPPDRLVDASDAILMFIEFYRTGELFDEAHSLENRFFSGLLNLKSEVRTAFITKQTAEHQKSLLRTACRVLNNFFEAGNYSETVEIGNFLIELIGNSDSFNDAKINLHLLVGKAKFHMGQYSDGMDHIEIALLSIPNIASGFENERRTACWYLIPRIRHLHTCYWIRETVMIVVAAPVLLVGVCVVAILTTIPFYRDTNNIYYKSDKPVLTLQQLSHNRALASTSTNLEIVNRCSKWIRFQLKEALSLVVKATFQSLQLSFVKFTKNLLHFTVCVLYVWFKLTCAYIVCLKIRWFRQPAKLRLAEYYISHYTFYFFVLDKFLSALLSCKGFIHVMETVRTICDPRFRYGEDGTPHADFLDSF